MKRSFLFTLIPAASLIFGGCAAHRFAPPTGHVTFSNSAANSQYGNGKVTLVTNNSSYKTKWCLYDYYADFLCSPGLNEGETISANYLYPKKVNISADVPVEVPTKKVPIARHKLTTITVTY